MDTLAQCLKGWYGDPPPPEGYTVCYWRYGGAYSETTDTLAEAVAFASTQHDAGNIAVAGILQGGTLVADWRERVEAYSDAH